MLSPHLFHTRAICAIGRRVHANPTRDLRILSLYSDGSLTHTHEYGICDPAKAIDTHRKYYSDFYRWICFDGLLIPYINVSIYTVCREFSRPAERRPETMAVIGHMCRTYRIVAYIM